ncbi:MAG: ribulose-phosphate 3-epimerase [Prevotellaceae bacterium]|nr:ribulose-phosphate 3-epimerase [Prevotellaceae bacterium]
MSVLISPSILSIDFAALRENIEMLNESEADWIHLDVMDGVFVPNISFGFPVLQAVSRLATKPLDVHYMIVHPEHYIQQTAQLGAYLMTVHAETCTQLHSTIHQIHSAGMKAGVSINPASPLSMIEDVITEADVILIMSVNPGFGGQKFIESTYEKIRVLRQMIKERGANTLIEVDGGVQNITAPLLVEAGADVLVSGSYIFNAEDPKATIIALKEP